MISPSIVIWNWIWVYLRSCICSKMSKVVCPYIGLEIGSGHFLCAVLFEVIDKVVPRRYWDLELDWLISEVMYIVETMYWIGNWIGSFPISHLFTRY